MVKHSAEGLAVRGGVVMVESAMVGQHETLTVGRVIETALLLVATTINIIVTCTALFAPPFIIFSALIAMYTLAQVSATLRLAGSHSGQQVAMAVVANRGSHPLGKR